MSLHHHHHHSISTRESKKQDTLLLPKLIDFQNSFTVGLSRKRVLK